MRIHGSGLNNADVSKLEMLGVTTVQLVNLTAKHTFAREEIEELKRIILEATMLPMQEEKHDLKLFLRLVSGPSMAPSTGHQRAMGPQITLCMPATQTGRRCWPSSCRSFLSLRRYLS